MTVPEDGVGDGVGVGVAELAAVICSETVLVLPLPSVARMVAAPAAAVDGMAALTESAGVVPLQPTVPCPTEKEVPFASTRTKLMVSPDVQPWPWEPSPTMVTDWPAWTVPGVTPQEPLVMVQVVGGGFEEQLLTTTWAEVVLSAVLVSPDDGLGVIVRTTLYDPAGMVLIVCVWVVDAPALSPGKV